MKLTPEQILHAYRKGVFPMGEEDGSVSWYSPDPRAIFPFEGFHVPKSLAKTLRQGKFEIRVNTDFAGVLAGCGAREETWITPEITQAYLTLHAQGWAHSVEAWQGGALVGGLYGVAIGGAFMGESMFSRVSDASKVALVHLMIRLDERGFILLDSQFPTVHLMRFGQALIPRKEYLARLARALQIPAKFA